MPHVPGHTPGTYVTSTGAYEAPDNKGAYIASTSGGTAPQGSNPAFNNQNNNNQTDQGGMTGRDAAAKAASSGTTTTNLQQTIGSLDRRIQKALKGGNTDLAKDLRSRQKKFVSQLGLQAAQEAMINEASLSNLENVKRQLRNNPKFLNTTGSQIYQDIMNQDFINPTIDLQNQFPKQYREMYPIGAAIQGGGPTIMGIKELFGMNDKTIPFIGDGVLPRDRYPLDALLEDAGVSMPKFAKEDTGIFMDKKIEPQYQVMNVGGLDNFFEPMITQGQNLVEKGQGIFQNYQDIIPEGFNLNLGDKSLGYKTPMPFNIPGNLNFSINPNEVGLMYEI